MIRDHSHHLTKSTVKETAFDRLPRSPRDPILEAERQGFDDGYFGNERFYAGQRAEADVYSKAYDEGADQRNRIDGRKKKK
jgi:hypothetical protein